MTNSGTIVQALQDVNATAFVKTGPCMASCMPILMQGPSMTHARTGVRSEPAVGNSAQTGLALG